MMGDVVKGRMVGCPSCFCSFGAEQTPEAGTGGGPGLPVENVVVCKEAGRYGGWPANNGIWSWGNEIVVGFDLGHFKAGVPGHPIDKEKPVELAQARSLDGGVTWKVERPEAFAAGREPTDCPGGIAFAHPDFALKCRMSDPDKGCSRFYCSYDRARTWQGPFRLPAFDLAFVAARTDYLVNGEDDCTVFLTGAKSDGKSGRPFCASTTDGGRSWRFLSWLTPEYKGYSIMSSSVRLSPVRIVSAVRRWEDPRNWVELVASDDDGRSWGLVTDCTPGRTEKDHYVTPHLIRLKDGRLCVCYGFRSAPYGVRARFSGDKGLTWGDEVILRADGGNWDLGYPRSAQRPDGRVVTVYYFNEAPDKERYIAATIWDPAPAKAKPAKT